MKRYFKGLKLAVKMAIDDYRKDKEHEFCDWQTLVVTIFALPVLVAYYTCTAEQDFEAHLKEEIDNSMYDELKDYEWEEG